MRPTRALVLRRRAVWLALCSSGALLPCAPVRAQASCAPPLFANDGFVTIADGHLMLDGQRFRIRGLNFSGGAFVKHWPLVPLKQPDGTESLEEVYTQSIPPSLYDPVAFEAELRVARQYLGLNAVRLATPSPRREAPYGSTDGWFLPDGRINPSSLADLKAQLCLYRRLGIKVQLALLFNIQNDGRGHLSSLPYPPEFMAFLRTYLESLIPELADDPTILAYEMSNETLPWVEQANTVAEVLPLLQDLIGKVRALDTRHLITSGEVAVPPSHSASWRWPTPELHVFSTSRGMLSIAGLVDYLSPHFYSFGTLPPAPCQSPYPYGEMIATTTEIKRRTGQPLAMGEMNRGARVDTNTDKTASEPERLPFFQMARAAAVRTCRNDPTCPSGRAPGMDGFMLWNPMPLMGLRPGQWAREFHCTGWPCNPTCDHPWPYLRLFGPGEASPERGLHHYDGWEILYYPSADPLTPPAPLPTGRIFRTSLTAAADFGGDGASDMAVYRPSLGQWLVHAKGQLAFGTSSDIPVAADYDGDGRTEAAFFRPVSQTPGETAAEWWFPDQATPLRFGHAGDVPLPGDYDGDGDAELAVFRPHANDDPTVAAWYLRGILTGLHYGKPDDLPVPADYDGDGDLDIAVFRPSTAQWFVRGQVSGLVFGQTGDVPVPADYDGDGDADMAVYRPSTGAWWISGLPGSTAWGGLAGDVPVPADYDGDSATDVAVFRPSAGQWLVRGRDPVPFGAPGDRPVVVRASAP